MNKNIFPITLIILTIAIYAVVRINYLSIDNSIVNFTLTEQSNIITELSNILINKMKNTISKNKLNKDQLEQIKNKSNLLIQKIDRIDTIMSINKKYQNSQLYYFKTTDDVQKINPLKEQIIALKVGIDSLNKLSNYEYQKYYNYLLVDSLHLKMNNEDFYNFYFTNLNINIIESNIKKLKLISNIMMYNSLNFINDNLFSENYIPLILFDRKKFQSNDSITGRIFFKDIKNDITKDIFPLQSDLYTAYFSRTGWILNFKKLYPKNKIEVRYFTILTDTRTVFTDNNFKYIKNEK